MTREQFLNHVQAYIESDPEAAAYVADRVRNGLNQALNKTLERAADMEACLALTMAGNAKETTQDFIKSRLWKWYGQTSLQWDWLLHRLES